MAVIAPAKNFTGSVAVVNGAEDLQLCAGNCSYPMNLAQAAISQLYPSTNTTGIYLAPLHWSWPQPSLFRGRGLPLHSKLHLEQQILIRVRLRRAMEIRIG